jgi:CRP/FNR family transcriptional regulator, cyclic AMP receptor protein
MPELNIPEIKLIGKEELIRLSPYFNGLSAAEVSVVERLAAEERYDRDSIVLHEGTIGRKLYLVASGAVKVFGTSADGKEQIIAIARPGDSFNDVAAFDGGETQAAAQALTPVVLYALNGRILLEKACQLGPLAANIVRALAVRVRQLGDLVSDLSFRPVAGRLARILLEQADNNRTPILTQRDMAAMAGTAREVVARALKGMEDEGIIRVERHRIEIIDRPALENLAV